jgi:preprotein translocase subunit SecD
MLYFANWQIALICVVCALGAAGSISTCSAHHSPRGCRVGCRTSRWRRLTCAGAPLLLEVDVAAAQRKKLNSIIDNVRNALRDANIGYTGLNGEGDAIVTDCEPAGSRMCAVRQEIDPDHRRHPLTARDDAVQRNRD